MTKLSRPVLVALAAALLAAQTPIAAQASAQAAQSVEADLKMAQDAAPFRRVADAFVAARSPATPQRRKPC